ncbi:GNAT family protein [Tenacibaculum ovolyticum]|uniref:GNAT family N-acetyltransferase n=1 Tax=Tenacibaculum ovolyticum TaxID=104270 RepID=UPI0004292189|nr:GNAT family N-acetyltransferase [Tenacibaculum ovolyticum]
MKNRNKFDYGIIDPCEIRYKELHNALFKGASISNDWISWYHKDIPNTLNSETITYAAFDGDILIGIWSVEPKLMNLNGKKINVGRCFAVGIHEGYRRLGLFVSLSEFAIKSEKERGEFEYVLGFPQKGRSVIGGHLKAGWEHVQEIDIYSISTFEKDDEYSFSNVEIIKNFESIKFPSNINGSLIENPEYKNTRWLNHPDLYYICLKYKKSFLILKVYSNFCHIVDFNGERKEVSHLLKSAKVLAYRHGWEEINIWAGENEFFINEIKKTGFTKGAKYGLPISMIAVRINKTIPLSLEMCHLQMGIEEGY